MLTFIKSTCFNGWSPRFFYSTAPRYRIELWPSTATFNFLFDFLIARSMPCSYKTKPSISIFNVYNPRGDPVFLLLFERGNSIREIKGLVHLFAGEKLPPRIDFWIRKEQIESLRIVNVSWPLHGHLIRSRIRNRNVVDDRVQSLLQECKGNWKRIVNT